MADFYRLKNELQRLIEVWEGASEEEAREVRRSISVFASGVPSLDLAERSGSGEGAVSRKRSIVDRRPSSGRSPVALAWQASYAAERKRSSALSSSSSDPHQVSGELGLDEGSPVHDDGAAQREVIVTPRIIEKDARRPPSFDCRCSVS